MDTILGRHSSSFLTSEMMRRVFRGIFGKDSFVFGTGTRLTPTIVNNTTIRISDGDLSVGGCVGGIPKGTTENITLSVGVAGQKRIDKIVCRYEKVASTGVETLSWKVIKGTQTTGTPTIPSHTTGDISAGATVDEFPVFAVHFDGTTITQIERLADPVLDLSRAVFYSSVAAED